MEAPPDEKALQELATATRGRAAGGKWRIVVAVLLLAALVVAGFAVVTESIRQSGISSAKKEAREAAEAVQARYAHVNDWPAWYRNRLPENWGGDKLQAWIDSAQPVANKHNLFDETLAYEIIRGLNGESAGFGAAELAAIHELRRDSESLIPGLAALTGYENLALLPDFTDGAPALKVIPILAAFKLVRFRILAAMFLDDWDAAWRELALLHSMACRMRPAASLVSEMIVMSLERFWMELLEAGLHSHAAPREIMENFAGETASRPLHWSELVDTELAFFAQITAPADAADLLLGREPSSEDERAVDGWFGYLQPELSWRERKQAYAGPAEAFRYTANYIKGMLAAQDALRGGLKLEDIRVEGDVWFDSQLQQETEMKLRRRFAVCLARIRLAELDYPNDTELQAALDSLAAEFPELELERTSGGIVLKYRDTPDNRKQLSYDEQDSKSFHEANPPVTLKPLKP